MAPPQTSTVYQYNTTQLPAWYEEYMSRIAKRGADLLPDKAGVWDPDMDELVAGASPDELAAWESLSLRNNPYGAGGWNQYINQGTRMTEAGMGHAASGANWNTQGGLNPYFARGNEMNFNDSLRSGDKYLERGTGTQLDAISDFRRAGNQDIASTYDPYASDARFLAMQGAGSTLGLASPYLQSAGSANGLSSASPYLNAASGSFPQNAAAYMSPYTSLVTDRIADLGARNLGESLLPQISDDFVRAGQYGSTRQRDLIGRALRDTQESVLGQQAQSLESGYGVAGQLYGQDAARQAQLAGTAGNLGLGQGSLQLQTGKTFADVGGADYGRSLEAGRDISEIGQRMAGLQQTDAARQMAAIQGSAQIGSNIASTGIQRGQLGLGATQAQSQNNLGLLNAQYAASEAAANRQLAGAGLAFQGGQQFAALGNQSQSQFLRDAAAREAIGATQRGISQQRLDANTQNKRNAEAYPWMNLSRAAGAISGVQLPTSGTMRGQSTQPGPSTAGQIAGIGLATAGLANSNLFGGRAKGGPVKKKHLSRVNYGGSPRRGLGMFAKAA